MSGAYTALAVGVNSLTGGGITNALGLGPDSSGGYGSASGTQAAADPFSPYRAKLGSTYSDMLTGSSPTDVTKMPGYTQFKTGVMDPALEASKRSAAASGMMRSGNEQIALQKQAQGGYYGFMTDYLNRLAQGSGAVNNPAAAASLGANVYGQQQAGVMQGLGAVATGLKGIYSSNSGFSDNSGWANGGNGTIDVNGYSGSVGNYFDPNYLDNRLAGTVEYT